MYGSKVATAVNDDIAKMQAELFGEVNCYHS